MQDTGIYIVRCYTCMKVLSPYYDTYSDLIGDGVSPRTAIRLIKLGNIINVGVESEITGEYITKLFEANDLDITRYNRLIKGTTPEEALELMKLSHILDIDHGSSSNEYIAGLFRFNNVFGRYKEYIRISNGLNEFDVLDLMGLSDKFKESRFTVNNMVNFFSSIDSMKRYEDYLKILAGLNASEIMKLMGLGYVLDSNYKHKNTNSYVKRLLVSSGMPGKYKQYIEIVNGTKVHKLLKLLGLEYILDTSPGCIITSDYVTKLFKENKVEYAFDSYIECISGEMNTRKALDILGVKRICCRMRVMSQAKIPLGRALNRDDGRVYETKPLEISRAFSNSSRMTNKSKLLEKFSKINVPLFSDDPPVRNANMAGKIRTPREGTLREFKTN